MVNPRLTERIQLVQGKYCSLEGGVYSFLGDPLALSPFPHASVSQILVII